MEEVGKKMYREEEGERRKIWRRWRNSRRARRRVDMGIFNYL